MFTLNVDPVLLTLGPLTLRWYALIVLAAIAVGIDLAVRESRRKGFVHDEIADSVFWVVLAGLAGARLFHVVDHWPDEFAADPARALRIWEGGLAIWGGVVGGLLALTLLAWRRGWNLPRLLDATAPGLVLAQALGRVACVITGDAMGQPTQGPFGIAYLHPNALVPQRGVFYTPMPVYELLANLGIFFVLWRLRGRAWPDGRLFLVYVILYSLVRFGLAYVSAYQVVAFGLTQSQVVALLALLGAVGVWAWQRVRTPAATIRA